MREAAQLKLDATCSPHPGGYGEHDVSQDFALESFIST